MLTINEILSVKPKFILAVNYDAGSIGEMVDEDRDLNLYLAEMTIQYHSLTNHACLAFTTECLVRVNDDEVTIDDMYTGGDNESIYAQNIAELTSIDGYGVHIYQNVLSDAMKDFLIDLIESQPIYDIPEHFIIETY